MKIKKIELQLSKKETIELTVEQARELRDILNDTFPVETKPEKEYVPYWPNYQPYIHWTYPLQQTWCSSSGNVDEMDLSVSTSDTLTLSMK